MPISNPSPNFALNGSTVSASLVAGNNITLLSNASTISIVGVAASGAAVNAIGAGTSTSTGSISLSAGAGIQVSSSGASVISIGTTGTNFNALIPAGNTAGAVQTYTGSVTMVAVSPLLFSMAATNQSLTVEGPTYSAASPLAVSTTNGIVSYAGPTYAAGGGLLLSTTGGTVSYSQTAQSSQTVISAVDISGNTSGTSSAISTGTLYLQAVSPMVLSQSTTVGTGSTTSNVLSIIAPAFSAGGGLLLSTTGGTISYSQTSVNVVSSLNGSTGALSLSAGAGIGIGQANSTITFSASVQTITQSLTGVGNTTLSSTATFSGLLSISGAGIVSVGMSGNELTISATTPSVTNLSTISLTASGANTFSSSTGTLNNVLAISGMGIASVGISANSVSISVPAPAFGTQTISASGTSVTGTAVSLAVAAGANISLQTATAAHDITISVSGLNALSANGFASSTGTMVLSAGGGIALSTGASTITISASVQTSSISLTASGANTFSSSTGTFSNVLAFSGMGVVSVGMSGNTISISAPTAAAGAVSLTAVSNVVANSTGVFSSPLVFSGDGIVSVGFTSNTVSIVASTASLAAGNGISIVNALGTIHIAEVVTALKVTQNMALQDIGGPIATATGTVMGTAGFGSSLFLQRIYIPQQLNLTEVDLAMGLSFPATNNGAGTMSQSWVLYSFGNSSSLVSVMSTSSTYAWATGTSTVGASTSLTQFQGGWSVQKLHPMTFAITSTSAGEYVVGNLIDFSQAASTWTIALLGQLGSITNSTTLSNVTTTGQTTFAGLSNAGTLSFSVLSNAGTAVRTALSAAAQLAITNVEATVAAASASGATLTSNSSYARSNVARTVLTASTSQSITAFTAAPTVASITAFSIAPTSATGLSSLALSTQSIVPQYLTVPNLVYIGTGSTTSALPSVFLAGIMSTGGIPAAITLTSTAVTYWGTAAGAQPYFALVGS